MLFTLKVQPVFVGWMFGDVRHRQSPACVYGLDVWRCWAQSESSLCLWVGCLEMLGTVKVQPVFMGWMFGDVRHSQSPACVYGLDVWRCWAQSESSLCLWVGCLEMLRTVKVQPVFMGWMFGDVGHSQSPACVYGLDVWRC